MFLQIASAVLALSSLGLASDAPAMKIESLQWLGGAWRSQRGGATVEEQWMAPRGKSMLGMSRTVAREKTSDFEFLRIEERDGKLVYIAQPRGGAATEFAATSLNNDEVLFENPQHDFPKKIRYRRVSPECVTASVEDETGNKKIEFPYCRP